jgi:hypothetical protein
MSDTSLRRLWEIHFKEKAFEAWVQTSHLTEKQAEIHLDRLQDQERRLAKEETERKYREANGIDQLYDFWICFSDSDLLFDEWLVGNPMTNEDALVRNKVLHEAATKDLQAGS